MQIPSTTRRISLAILITSLIANSMLVVYIADYPPAIHTLLVAGLLIISCAAAWFTGAHAILRPEPGTRLNAIAGSLLIAPFALFALLVGIGPPHDQPLADNDLRFLLLAINALLVGAGIIVLCSSLALAGERVYATLALAAIVLATPFYAMFCLIQRTDYVAQQLGWSWAASVAGLARELTPLDALSIIMLFMAGVLTYLATAAIARGMAITGWLGRLGSGVLMTLSAIGLGFLLARGMAYPSMTAALSHWYTVPGFIAGIPAVPWMMPCAIGVILLRRSGNSAAAGV